MTRLHRPFPARAGSAIPLPLRDTDDAVVRAGKLWEQHVALCPRCEIATPGCDLGAKSYDVYVFLANSEGRFAKQNCRESEAV